MEAAADRFPAASRASTPTVYDLPQARSDSVAFGSDVFRIGVPLMRTRYPVTPTSSLAAVQASARLPAERAVTVRPVGVEGGRVSAHAAVRTNTLASADRFPAASPASTA